MSSLMLSDWITRLRARCNILLKALCSPTSHNPSGRARLSGIQDAKRHLAPKALLRFVGCTATIPPKMIKLSIYNPKLNIRLWSRVTIPGKSSGCFWETGRLVEQILEQRMCSQVGSSPCSGTGPPDDMVHRSVPLLALNACTEPSTVLSSTIALPQRECHRQPPRVSPDANAPVPHPAGRWRCLTCGNNAAQQDCCTWRGASHVGYAARRGVVSGHELLGMRTQEAVGCHGKGRSV